MNICKISNPELKNKSVFIMDKFNSTMITSFKTKVALQTWHAPGEHDFFSYLAISVLNVFNSSNTTSSNFEDLMTFMKIKEEYSTNVFDGLIKYLISFLEISDSNLVIAQDARKNESLNEAVYIKLFECVKPTIVHAITNWSEKESVKLIGKVCFNVEV